MSDYKSNPHTQMDLAEMATRGRPKEWRALPGGHELILEAVVRETGAKRVLEFGPGESTRALLKAGVEHITTCEHHAEYAEAAAKEFAGEPRVRVLHYTDAFPVVVEGLDDKEKFDLGFVDSPQGYNPVRKIHPGFEDCSRLNTLMFALERCKTVLLHDANRPLERGSLARLWKAGWDWDWLSCGEANAKGLIARITRRAIEARPDLPRVAEPGSVTPGADPGQRGLPERKRRARRPGGGTQREGCDRPAECANQ